MYEFEVIDKNQIVVFCNGVEDKDTIGYDEYDKSFKSQGKECNLIPYSFYRFLRRIQMPVYNREKFEEFIAPKLSASILTALYEFQREAIYKMVMKKRIMNACSPGLGKTIQALSSLLACRKPSTCDLILCPGYLRANWLSECKKWFPRDVLNKVVLITKAGKNDFGGVVETIFKSQDSVIIISYDMFVNVVNKVTHRRSFNTIVIDESHFLKDLNTKRVKLISGIAKNCENLFLLTGTPSPNRVKELYSQYAMIEPNVFTNYFTFANRYCDGHKDRWGHFDDRGSSRLRELTYLSSKIMIRLRREDYLNNLPSVVREKVLVQPASIPREFRKKRQLFIEELSKIDHDKSAAFRVQTLASAMFRDTAAIKVGSVLEYLASVVTVENQEKIVFFFVLIRR